ncbi:MAG: hypothetical protein CVV64_12090 [Candidatus Wallbacteria bacterium HGW-Wallbacteria-1]|uniref:histidine kinase n=1 Tax=Candidatus Wallbacteria bacterium HGW-Wallbacteria-1 TaxID=2013854 RepID=A0A2N1PNF6_9BACT|nr:MAG: hypothetical protein CVV64_12090 [Candidatus Wallbacteria bacterium HGW-Wallbacteria-1]
MSSETLVFIPLINNSGLLLALAAIYDAVNLEDRLNMRYKNIVLGILIGIITIAVMATPLHFANGVIFDTRSIVLSLTALFFGCIPAFIASVFSILFRIHIGGIGTLTGCLLAISSILIGLAWRKIRNSDRNISFFELYIFGIVNHLSMLALMYTLPRQTALQVLAGITWPVLTIFPIATVILGKLLLRQKKRLENLDIVAAHERKFRKILVQGWDIITLLSEDLKVRETLGRVDLITNDESRNLNGLSFPDCFAEGKKELIQLSITACLLDPSISRTIQLPLNIHTGEELPKPDADFPWVEISISNFLHDADVNAILVIIRDISGQKADQESAEAMAGRLALACNSAEMGIWDLDLLNDRLIWDDQMFQIYGVDPVNFTSHFEEWAKYVHPDDLDPTWTIIQKAINEAGNFALQFRIIRPDGQIAHIEAHGITEANHDGQSTRLIGVNRDITKRVRAEAELKKSETVLRKAQAVAKIGTWEFHFESSRVMASPEAREIYGLSHDKEYSISDIQQLPLPEYRDGLNIALKSVIENEQPYSIEFQMRKPSDNQLVWIHSRAEYDPSTRIISGIIQDISEPQKAVAEREKLLSQLRQSQKMEAIGRLAGGVAHDFNNMLNVIMGFSDLAIARIGTDNPLARDIEEIQQAATRSAELTRQLLAFSRKEVIAPRPLNLNQQISNSLKMIQAMVGENIRIITDLNSDLWNVKMDPSQISQILTNMAINARDAILNHIDSERHPGVGLIILSTANKTLNTQQISKLSPSSMPGSADYNPEILAGGDYVMLKIQDNGSGITPDVLEHIFEPFFTTKAEGEGTGLGLATIYGIVNQNGGHIMAASTPGNGSEFTIILPRCLQEITSDEKGYPDPSSDSYADSSLEDTQTILIVEDEAQLLSLAERILTKRGYRVLTALSPEEAMKIASTERKSIALLLTDVIMPGMNGKELRHAIERLIPEIPTLFMSGYTAEVITARGFLEDGFDFIPKPFSPRELAQSVKAILDRNIKTQRDRTKKEGPPDDEPSVKQLDII